VRWSALPRGTRRSMKRETAILWGFNDGPGIRFRSNKDLPAWCVRYGEEPWRTPRGRPDAGKSGGTLRLPARIDVGISSIASGTRLSPSPVGLFRSCAPTPTWQALAAVMWCSRRIGPAAQAASGRDRWQILRPKYGCAPRRSRWRASGCTQTPARDRVIVWCSGTPRNGALATASFSIRPHGQRA
jgi:hypothetical protein